tara:strand:+ start:403 stop:543 length:141 start_codon:yes stop_codon:yes gene_type:complete
MGQEVSCNAQQGKGENHWSRGYRASKLADYFKDTKISFVTSSANSI